ncbi:hypothetical protein BP5796_05049 [Coleophoma crateriformis]|uniref:Major facilitator superfamily (MFS) profile domain-containing protein n=1 Tax=Coleophoma crateriformis TaxID=565419 RepID=A0A3D8S2M4_9HELO|nr:hypothetical protein BP5796_05049 [Coleophoma crateriformis]
MTAQAGAQSVGRDLAELLPRDGKAWWKKRHLLSLNMMLFSAMMFSSAGGYDNSMMNGLQALEQWQVFMGHPVGAWLGFINAAQALGVIFGYPAMAYCADRWGRKRSVYYGVALLAVATGLQTGASSEAMFIVARFLVGTASAFFGAIPVLITETAFPTHRGKMTAGYNTLYYVGSLVSAWATFGTRNYTTSWAWRIPSILQMLIPTVSLPGFFLCPESPRWLINQGRTNEAREFFFKYHAGGDYQSPLVPFEMAEIEEALEAEKVNHQTGSYADMIKTKGNRHRLFVSVALGIFAQWNGVGVVSYYLAAVLTTVGITSVTQQTLINGFLQLWNLFIAVSAASLVDRVGRRPLLILSSFGMLICYVIITGLSGSFASTQHAATGLAVIPMLFIYYGFYDIAFTPLLISYPAEIWQYQLRSRGIAVTFTSTMLALFFNLFVNPIALNAIAWKYYIVYVAILVLICFTAWFCFPETRGRSLEEIAVLFDGEDANVAPPGAVREAIQLKMADKETMHVENVKEA